MRRQSSMVRERLAHVVVARDLRGIIRGDHPLQLRAVIRFGREPRDVADVVRIEDVVRDQVLVRKRRGDRTRSREDVGEGLNLAAALVNDASDAPGYLGLVAQIAATADLQISIFA